LQRLAELKYDHNLLMGLTVTGANQVGVLRKAITVEVDGKRLFDAFQVTYNILDQSLAEVAEMIKAEGGRIIIKEALANGRMFPNERFPHYQMLYQTLQKMAQAYGVGIDAIALRFCVDSLSPYKVLSGVSSALHLADNAKVEDFVLREEDVAHLKNFRIDPEIYWKERKALAWN
jgi:aryl-alcohol dehydrogenase-like predicted oxidoreductase